MILLLACGDIESSIDDQNRGNFNDKDLHDLNDLTKRGFVFDPNTFDINDEKALNYVGLLLNAEKTLTTNGGFYNPISNNPDNIKIQGSSKYWDQLLKIAVQGILPLYDEQRFFSPYLLTKNNPINPITKINLTHTLRNSYKGFSQVKEHNYDDHMGRYIVKQVQIPWEKDHILQYIYAEPLNLRKNRAGHIAMYDTSKTTFHVHSYHGYQQDDKRPVIFGFFNTIKDEVNKTVTVAGKINIHLTTFKAKTETDKAKQTQQLLISLVGKNNIGIKGNGGVILAQDDVALSGQLILKYKDIEKKYDLANLSFQDKGKLRQLNLITLN